MFVNVNFSREVYEYFKGHDLNQVANTLLDMYDFTNLPPTEGKRYTEKKLDITNEAFISLYKTLGPRNKKVSLARLFEFAYNMDVLTLPRFASMRVTTTAPDPAYPAFSLVTKAYRALLDAEKLCPSDELRTLVEAVYTYKCHMASTLREGEV